MELNNAIRSQLSKIAFHYGFTNQADMLTEEAAEYTVALNKFRRGKPDAYKSIKEEVADVLVVALQLRELLGDKEIDKIIQEKIDRQLRRIEEEKKNGSENTGKSLCNLWKHNS